MLVRRGHELRLQTVERFAVLGAFKAEGGPAQACSLPLHACFGCACLLVDCLNNLPRSMKVIHSCIPLFYLSSSSHQFVPAPCRVGMWCSSIITTFSLVGLHGGDPACCQPLPILFSTWLHVVGVCCPNLFCLLQCVRSVLPQLLCD
jgi:hypothetical protein